MTAPLETAPFPMPKLQKGIGNHKPQDNDSPTATPPVPLRELQPIDISLRNVESSPVSNTSQKKPGGGKAGEKVQLHPDDARGKNLPEEFYADRPELRQVQQAAYSRMVSPDAVFHSILARIAGAVPHELKLPPIVGAPAPLCYFAAVAGASNTGKSSAWAIARELLPLPEYVLDGLPVGSGEGLAEILFDWVDDPEGGKKQVKLQVHHNAVVYIDEGAMVSEIAKRSGSTLMATLRQIWSGQTFGQTNAAQDRL